MTEIGSRWAVVFTPNQSGSMLWANFGHSGVVIYQALPTVTTVQLWAEVVQDKM